MTRSDLPADLVEFGRQIARTPPYLYKYVSVQGKRLGWLTASITHSTLYFSTRDELNDPYEFGGHPSFAARPSEVRNWCEREIDRSHFDEAFYAQRLAELLEATRNPAQAAYEARKFFQVQDETTAILSLCESPHSLAMWTYYADGCRGACIVLDTSLETIAAFPDKPVPYPVRVTYTKKMPTYRFYAVRHARYIQVTVGTKMDVMKSEREWRLVHPTKRALVAAPPQMICAVILGARMAPRARSRVIRACREAQYPILVYRAVPRSNRYAVRIEELPGV